MKDIICGDSTQILPMILNDSVDLIVTDPPYGVKFMGLDWDKALPDKAIWRECYRVLKPGAHMFVLALPRMYHHVAVAIEDVGFVLNTPLIWLFATGFPKGLDIGKAFDKRACREWLDTLPQEATGRLMVRGHNEFVIETAGTPDADELLDEEDWAKALPKLRRKVLSTAVGGVFTDETQRIVESVISGTTSSRPKGGTMPAPMSWGNGPVDSKRDEGARLLAAVLEEFWHGEGLPPGVRVKVGERQYAGSAGNNDNFGIMGSGGENQSKRSLSAPSTSLAQRWDGWKSPQLKPAMEMIVFASKPLSERTFAENVERWGTGGINVRKARIPTTQVERDWQRATARPNKPTTGWGQNFGTEMLAPAGFEPAIEGRYPANVIAEEGCVLPADRMRFFNISLWAETHGICDTLKASRKEKEAGLEGMPITRQTLGKGMKGEGRNVEMGSGVPTLNPHATVKPLVLMSWLILLGCPEGGLVLDPFMGTGTTLIGASQLGMQYLGIEIDPKWCDIARRRVKYAQEDDNYDR